MFEVPYPPGLSAYELRAANLRTKILDSGGFDSSIISVVRGGIPRPIGEFLEMLGQRVSVGITLVGRLGAWSFAAPNKATKNDNNACLTYIYIYIERERDVYIYIYIYVYIYIYIYNTPIRIHIHISYMLVPRTPVRGAPFHPHSLRELDPDIKL